jgi:hypothetical protein
MRGSIIFPGLYAGSLAKACSSIWTNRWYLSNDGLLDRPAKWEQFCDRRTNEQCSVSRAKFGAIGGEIAWNIPRGPLETYNTILSAASSSPLSLSPKMEPNLLHSLLIRINDYMKESRYGRCSGAHNNMAVMEFLTVSVAPRSFNSLHLSASAH